jgi:hypothetical protein
MTEEGAPEHLDSLALLYTGQAVAAVRAITRCNPPAGGRELPRLPVLLARPARRGARARRTRRPPLRELERRHRNLSLAAAHRPKPLSSETDLDHTQARVRNGADSPRQRHLCGRHRAGSRPHATRDLSHDHALASPAGRASRQRLGRREAPSNSATRPESFPARAPKTTTRTGSSGQAAPSKLERPVELDHQGCD